MYKLVIPLFTQITKVKIINIEIEGKCYYEEDIVILRDFIRLNESLNNRNPLKIGVQKWKNMRLDYLYLGVIFASP